MAHRVSQVQQVEQVSIAKLKKWIDMKIDILLKNSGVE